MEHLCILIAIQSGLLEAIVEKDGASVSAAELAKKTGVEELLIGEIDFSDKLHNANEPPVQCVS